MAEAAVRKKLSIVDGANYLFRAFYAIPPLSTSKGLPTNALYGFAQMLLALVRDEQPDYMIVAFDTKEPTFRHKLSPSYKANRAEPPEDLVPQFPYAKSVVEALNIAVLEKPGFEADDLIGTVAAKLASDDLEVVMVSGDKDLMQLVNGNVSLLDTMKGVKFTSVEVEKKFGVPPSQVIEVLGLAGDTSDNIPGVPGIGLKTAAKLIQTYGSVEEVIAHVEEMSPILREKIVANVEQARISKQLVTIDVAVPVSLNLEQFVRRKPDIEKSRRLFTELEFTRLLAALAPSTKVDRTAYRLIVDEAALDDLISTIATRKRFAFDLETTSLNTSDAEIVGVALAWGAGEACYIPVGHHLELQATQLSRDTVLQKLQPFFNDPEMEVIGQNLKYDLEILKCHGHECRAPIFDTMLASYLLNPSGSHGLDALAEQELGHTTIKYEEVTGKGKKQISFSQVPLEAACAYAAEDADVTFQLAEKFKPRLVAEGLESLMQELELPLLRVLIDMELSGVLIDTEQLHVLSKEFEGKLQNLEKKIYEQAGGAFNIKSPKQLGEILFGKLGLKGAKKTKTGYSTNQSVLEDLALEHELPGLVLEYRSFAKLKSTYVDALPLLVNAKTGRLHTSLNQTVAATGRLSSSDPNLQNIPIRGEEGRKIRHAFIAPGGALLLDCDYSQIELRVLAHMSEDDALLKAFQEGRDVHAMTAAGIFGGTPETVTPAQRAVGKTVNFSVVYGQGAFGLSHQLDISPEEGRAYIDRYFAAYPKVASYRDQILERARIEKRVQTLFGRRRLVPDMTHPNMQVRQAAERIAFNTVFQGTAADIIKRAMIAIHEKLPTISAEAKMILQVHDELIFEVPEKELETVKIFVVKEMETAASLKVPLIVDANTASNWADAH